MSVRLGLRTPIRLFSTYTACQLAELLEVSSGIRPATIDDGTPAYSSIAMVPKEPWRSLKATEISLLFELTGAWEQHRSVAILKPSVALDTVLAAKRLATTPYKRDDAPEISEAIINALAGECEVALDYVFLISHNAPNLVTVTIDQRINQRIGLHVDSWEKLPIAKRPFAQNRISINLGPTSRYVLLIPAALQEIQALVASKLRVSLELPRLITAFMNEFAGCPVVRFKLAPGASYIVPTENMVHDGSTAGQSAVNYSAILRGHVRPQCNGLAG
jgi:hypothetical protein